MSTPASHRRDVVHPHRLDTLCIIVADRQPCLALASEDALKQTGRRFRVLSQAELAAFEPPASWAMGVILCPGDDTANVARWFARHRAHPGRVSFHYHPTVDLQAALGAWAEAGHPIHSAWPATKWGDLSSKLGAHLNSVAHDDHCSDPLCQFREMR